MWLFLEHQRFTRIFVTCYHEIHYMQSTCTCCYHVIYMISNFKLIEFFTFTEEASFILKIRTDLAYVPHVIISLSTEAWQFSILSSHAGNIFYIILNVDSKHRLVLKTIQVKGIFAHVLRFPNIKNTNMIPIRIFGEPYLHEFCAVNTFGISPVVKIHITC